jgi:hypothetical protein
LQSKLEKRDLVQTGQEITWARAGAGLVLAAVLIAAPIATPAYGQAVPSSASGLGSGLGFGLGSLAASRELAGAHAVRDGAIIREIDDPHNGDRWLLVDDSRHPGGPGLLVQASSAGMNSSDGTNGQDRMSSREARPQAETPAPIIRAGDRVIVEEKTPVVEARLEAVAMGPAQAGSPFNVRLSIGGKVVRALAVEPGRAVLQTETRP